VDSATVGVADTTGEWYVGDSTPRRSSPSHQVGTPAPSTAKTRYGVAAASARHPPSWRIPRCHLRHATCHTLRLPCHPPTLIPRVHCGQRRRRAMRQRRGYPPAHPMPAPHATRFAILAQSGRLLTRPPDRVIRLTISDPCLGPTAFPSVHCHASPRNPCAWATGWIRAPGRPSYRPLSIPGAALESACRTRPATISRIAGIRLNGPVSSPPSPPA
jgi:hypothetical protein